MAQLLLQAPAPLPIHAITAKIEKVKSTFAKLAGGGSMSTDALLDVPAMREIEHDLMTTKFRIPKSKAQLRARLHEEIGTQDEFIQMYTVTHILEQMTSSRTDNNKAAFYTLLQAAFDKYGITPELAIKKFPLNPAENKKMAQVMLDGAIIFVREHLTGVFKKAALYPEGAAKLRSGQRLSSEDKINVVMGPVDSDESFRLLTTLEQAVRAVDPAADYMDYIDEVMPKNIFANPPKPEFKKVSGKDDAVQCLLTSCLEEVSTSVDVQERAAAYECFLEIMSGRGGSIKAYLATRGEADRARCLELIQSGALAYAHEQFKALAEPFAPEDEAVINDVDAEPSAQIDAMFRNWTSKEAELKSIRLLSVLEDAGFEMDETGLAARILHDEMAETPEVSPRSSVAFFRTSRLG